MGDHARGDKTMSAFIISDETMNRAVNAIRESGNWPISITRGDFDTPDGLTVLGVQLFGLNDDAVSQRYQDERDPEPMPYRYRPSRCSAAAHLKALQCLIYQCSEGDVPSRPIYKALRNAEHALMNKIIRSLPDYQKAEWDAV
jgi:hypothetical protein